MKIDKNNWGSEVSGYDCIIFVSTYKNLKEVFHDCVYKPKHSDKKFSAENLSENSPKKKLWQQILFAIPILGNGCALIVLTLRFFLRKETKEELNTVSDKDLLTIKNEIYESREMKWGYLEWDFSEMKSIIDKAGPNAKNNSEIFKNLINNVLDQGKNPSLPWISNIMKIAGSDVKNNPAFFNSVIDNMLNQELSSLDRGWIRVFLDEAGPNIQKNTDLFKGLIEKMLYTENGIKWIPEVIGKIGPDLKFLKNVINKMLLKKEGFLLISTVIQNARVNIENNSNFLKDLIRKMLDKKFDKDYRIAKRWAEDLIQLTSPLEDSDRSSDLMRKIQDEMRGEADELDDHKRDNYNQWVRFLKNNPKLYKEDLIKKIQNDMLDENRRIMNCQIEELIVRAGPKVTNDPKFFKDVVNWLVEKRPFCRLIADIIRRVGSDSQFFKNVFNEILHKKKGLQHLWLIANKIDSDPSFFKTVIQKMLEHKKGCKFVSYFGFVSDGVVSSDPEFFQAIIKEMLQKEDGFKYAWRIVNKAGSDPKFFQGIIKEMLQKEDGFKYVGGIVDKAGSDPKFFQSIIKEILQKEDGFKYVGGIVNKAGSDSKFFQGVLEEMLHQGKGFRYIQEVVRKAGSDPDFFKMVINEMLNKKDGVYHISYITDSLDPNIKNNLDFFNYVIDKALEYGIYSITSILKSAGEDLKKNLIFFRHTIDKMLGKGAKPRLLQEIIDEADPSINLEVQEYAEEQLKRKEISSKTFFQRNFGNWW